MKKFFALIIFTLILSVGLNAQRSGSTTGLGAGTQKTLTLTAADTITQGGTSEWTFDVNRSNSYFYTFAAAIDTLAPTNRLSATVWGSMDNVNWVASGITQLNVFPTAGGGADTTFQMSSVTTASLWRYLKFRLISLDANVRGSKLKGLSLKVGDRK